MPRFGEWSEEGGDAPTEAAAAETNEAQEGEMMEGIKNAVSAALETIKLPEGVEARGVLEEMKAILSSRVAKLAAAGISMLVSTGSALSIKTFNSFEVSGLQDAATAAVSLVGEVINQPGVNETFSALNSTMLQNATAIASGAAGHIPNLINASASFAINIV